MVKEFSHKRWRRIAWLVPALAAIAMGASAPAQQPALIVPAPFTLPQTVVEPAPVKALPGPSKVDSPAAPHETSYRMAPFGQISVYQPDGAPKGVMLLLSGDGGWNPGEISIARALANRGVLVAGFSTTAFLNTLEAGKGKCINPNYPLVDLARDVQHRMGVKSYMKPIIFGYSSGATVAYAALSQWPNGGYKAVASLGFGPDLPGSKKWCAVPGFAVSHVTKPEKGWLFAPNNRIKVPWIVLQGLKDQVVNPDDARRFAGTIPAAKLIELPLVGHGFAVQDNWMPQFMSAIAPMLAPTYRIPRGRGPNATLPPDLPLTLVPANGGPRTNTMAIIYSGDGGWVGIDRDVAGELAHAGIPVVGMDSLSYFWSARTPRGAGADLSKIVNVFSQRWHRPHVLLIGYSFGADVLPHMIENMDRSARSRITGVTLLGLSPTADFQFRLGSWLDISSAQALPTIPVVARLSGMPIRCVRGVDEDDSACPALPRGSATMFIVPGGHHFNRNAALLARIILRGNTGLPAAPRT
jgi:type IV secretory pathway VirJ component